jgi:peptidoglycan/xylan/chitin deacetylase (PgdA/CDA1 family)
MDPSDAHARRREQARERQLRANPARFAAIGSLVAVAGILAAIVLGSGSGSGSHARTTAAKPSSGAVHRAAPVSRGTSKPGTATVPILTYRVINVPPPGSGASRDLYVPADEFSAQMTALKGAGWHAVTLNELEAYWTRGVPLGSGNPIVITFDGGFASQYANALPVLKRLGWVGVTNLQASGPPPSDGGLTDSQVRGLIAAGWELGAEGNTTPALSGVVPADLQSEIASERQTLRGRYRAAVNWFAYPSGRYDPTTTVAVRAAGFTGAMTLESGWASPKSDRFRLPRLRVAGGTSPSQLLSQIASAKHSTSVPASSAGV